MMDRLQPTTYHREVAEYLKGTEPQLWEWFSSAEAQANYAEKLRLNLLKRCYRLHGDSHPELAQAGREAAERLGLSIPVTFYQARQTQELNASLYFLRGEGHVVFSGPVLSLLNSREIMAVVGHELAHHFLWQEEEGKFLVADRLIQAMAEHPETTRSQGQTARRFRLQTEIFADRGALAVVGDLGIVVASLVKMETGLQQVSGEQYLAQAEEIFARGPVWSEGISHPETFIRARALKLWSEQAPKLDLEVQRMIHGVEGLEDLDLLDQARVTGLTRRLLGQMLRPAWLQTVSTLAHAKMFFADFTPATEADAGVGEEFAHLPESVREYFGWVLLDFCVVDPDLEQAPIAAGFEWSRRLGIEDLFAGLLSRELKITARELKRLQSAAAQTVRQAEGVS